MGLQGVKGSYRGLQRNTKNDRGLQPVKRERKRSKWLNKEKKQDNQTISFVDLKRKTWFVKNGNF